jgi:hypothetical protein
LYGYDPGGLQESDAQDAADAADYLNLQKNVAARNAPALPDTQPPPFDPYAVPPNVGAPPDIAAPPDSAAAPPPGLPSAPPVGTDGTTPQAGPMAETPMHPGATAQNPSVAAPQPLADLGPPPARPKLTGDPTKDNQANLEWSQQLGDYQVTLAKRQGELAKHADTVAADKAKREAEEERRVAGVRQAEAAEFQARQQARQQQIDDAVKEKQAAYTDLKNPSGTSFADRLGAAIAIALGGIGQGLMLKGHVAGAQNEGLNAVNKSIEQDHQRKLERLKSASDSIMEARYGFKDAADNHRAALNDLDADRAAKYRLIASEAEEQLRAQGVSDADIKTNAVVLNALQEAAKSTDTITAREEAEGVKRDTAKASAAASAARFDQGERQIEATIANHKETAAEARARLALATQSEADRRDDRRRALTDKENADKEKATVGSVRQNAVLGNLAEAEKAAKDVGEVSIDAINKLQTNTEQAKAGEHSATSGVVGNVMTRAARATGLAARGQYDGISDAEQKKITAANQVITHLTEMQQGKNIETLEQYRDRYSPYVPGLSVDEVRRREKALPGLVAEQRAIQDPQGVGAKRQEKATPQTDQEQAREHLGKGKPQKEAALPPGAKPATKGGRQGIILNGQFYPKL